MEGVGHRGANGGEQGKSRVSVSFVLLAGCTAFDVFMDIGGQTGPPEFSRDMLMGFQVSRVASHFMIMTMLEDRVVEGFIIGNIDVSLVGEDTCFNLPVRKAGTKWECHIPEFNQVQP